MPSFCQIMIFGFFHDTTLHYEQYLLHWQSIWHQSYATPLWQLPHSLPASGNTALLVLLEQLASSQGPGLTMAKDTQPSFLFLLPCLCSVALPSPQNATSGPCSCPLAY